MNARRFVKMLCLSLLLSPAWVSAQFTIDRRQLPDLVPADVTLGADCRIIVTLHNNGPGIVLNAGYSVSPAGGGSAVQISKDGAPWDGILLGELDPAHATQPVGGTVNYAWRLALPAGTHVIKFDVDTSNTIAESNELNNSLTKRLTCSPPPMPDLVPIDMTLDANCRIDVTIKNVGAGIIPDAAYAGGTTSSAAMQMFNDGVPFGGLILAGFDPAKAAQPVGGTAVYKWDLPLPAGVHTLKFDVDGANSIAESNEANNSLTKTLTCQVPLPDLTAINISLQPTGGTVTGPCQIVITFKNNGPGIVPDAAFAPLASAPGVQVYNDGVGWGGAIIGAIDPTKVLQPAGATLVHSWALGSTTLLVPQGTHVLRVDVDDNNALVESNEANNSRIQTLACGGAAPPPQP